MSQIIARRPSVFSVEGTVELPDHPSLKGCRCKCGHVFFPRQYFGCEACGRLSDEIEDIEFSGIGTLREFATVHRSALKELKAPYTVATIFLEAGCAIRALIDTEDLSLLSAGQIVYSTLTVVGQDDQGRDIVDLRFTPDHSNHLKVRI